MLILCLLLLVLAGEAAAEAAADPAWEALDHAYRALQDKQYESALAWFREALQAAPERTAARKDFAYTLLKVGETEQARDQFAKVMRSDPQDLPAAMEYAFLCHETGKTAEARRTFDRVRRTAPSPDLRAAAEQAFENVDRPLREGIERWRQALEANPQDYNAHRELADLAERRDDADLAAAHYLEAWRLRPWQRSLLVDYGRAALLAGKAEQARAALVAAMWGGEPRAAESARKLFGERYPYVYEFRQAVALDPDNLELRQELANLLAAMGRKEESDQEFAALAQARSRNTRAPDSSLREAKELALKSYRAGYLKDALKFGLAAHEQDPLDFDVILHLGWTYNVLRQDQQAYQWFRLARKSPDASIAREAERAYRALRSSQGGFRVSGWMYPVYSSRWRDVFAYGQLKLERKLGRLPARVYFSTRLVGNGRQVGREARVQAPYQYLSEGSFIPAAGVATDYWRGFMLWAEAGVSANYHVSGRNLPGKQGDFRGGLAFVKGFGALAGGRKTGWFFETNGDTVFLSRFENDLLFYSQNRTGLTLRPWSSLGGLQTQWMLAFNAGADLRRQYWANTLEAGPGVRFRWEWMPPSLLFSVSWVRGRYGVMQGNPWERMYRDLRVGFWYAFVR